jgi:hypothetical protein
MRKNAKQYRKSDYIIQLSERLPGNKMGISQNKGKGKGKSKGKVLPLPAWMGPEGSRRLGIPDFKTIGT